MKIYKLLIPVVLFMTYSCHRKEKIEDTVRSVKCETVIPVEDNKEVSSFPGRVKAASDINLSFRVSGPIVKINCKEGTFVKQGTMLAQIDPRDYETQLSATEAEYKSVKGEAERVIELYNRQSAAQNDYDKAVYGLKQMEAKLSAHRNALADTKIYAPFDGYIHKLYYDENETVAAGLPIVAMVSTKGPEVEINLPSSEYLKRNNYSSATCYIDVYPGKVFCLDLIGATPKANLNQLYSTRFKIIACEGVTPTPGMTAMVRIKYKNENDNSFRIPASALLNKGDNSYVWIFNPSTDTVNLRKVKVEQLTTDGYALITSGVKENEEVVTAGINSLKEGQTVKKLKPVSKTNIGGIL